MAYAHKKSMVIGGTIVTAALVLAAGVAASGMGDDDDLPLTGDTYDRAVTAALAHTGGGTVLETELGDGGAAYGVEVRLADGSEVEVNLDRDFNVIGSEQDDDTEGEEDD